VRHIFNGLATSESIDAEKTPKSAMEIGRFVPQCLRLIGVVLWDMLSSGRREAEARRSRIAQRAERRLGLINLGKMLRDCGRQRAGGLAGR
jgi:hypothetical protein